MSLHIAVAYGLCLLAREAEKKYKEYKSKKK